MKPLVRYIQARVSGKDPHGLVRRSSSTKYSWHHHWYSRLWSSRPSLPGADFRNDHGWTSPPGLPSKEPGHPSREPYALGVRLEPADDKAFQHVSLELPLQGRTMAEDLYEEMPRLRKDDLVRGVMKDMDHRRRNEKI